MPANKLTDLIKNLRYLDNSLIAYSGGVDSTFLVRTAQIADIRFLAVIGRSETMPRHDLETAKSIVAKFNMPYQIIKTDELKDRNFVKNPPDRCYYCKDGLFGTLREIAQERGYTYILDGSNADDLDDDRPGFRANEKHDVKSPLIEAGIGKKEIRALSKKLGLPTWNRPSSPCLSSRFPHGMEITPSALGMVSSAEDYLRKQGFRVIRVRTAGTGAAIEVGKEEVKRLSSRGLQKEILEAFRRIGYTSVVIDPEGYKTGNVNQKSYAERLGKLIDLDTFTG